MSRRLQRGIFRWKVQKRTTNALFRPFHGHLTPRREQGPCSSYRTNASTLTRAPPPRARCFPRVTSHELRITAVRSCYKWGDGILAYRRTAAAPPHGARIRRGRNRSARDGVGRGLAVPVRNHSQAGRNGFSRRDLPREIRRRGNGLRRIRDHHRGAFARGWLGGDHRRRAQFALHESHLTNSARKSRGRSTWCRWRRGRSSAAGR